MFCARDLIKYELRSTRLLNPQPPEDQIQIACPHCMQESDCGRPLFQDVDKSQPAKVYTDSPTGSVILGMGEPTLA